jgi:hypothetical protein
VGNVLLSLIEPTSRDCGVKTRLGRGMQWYVYLITIPTAAFLAQIAVELAGQPIRKIVRLRRVALEQIAFFRNISLPRPRELAISSRQIREYDHAVKNVRAAQHAFRDLGTQLLAFSENEPAIRKVMALLGVNIAQAGHELIILSEIYSLAKTDSDELRRDIKNAFCTISVALAASRHSPREDLIKIRLEPMYLRDVAFPRKRNKPLGQPRTASLHAPQKALRAHYLRQQMPQPSLPDLRF